MTKKPPPPQDMSSNGYAPSWYGVEDDEYLDSLPKDEATRKALAKALSDLMDRQKARQKAKGS